MPHKAMVALDAMGFGGKPGTSRAALCIEIATSPGLVCTNVARGSSVAWISHIDPLLSMDDRGCNGLASHCMERRAFRTWPRSRSDPNGKGPAKNCCLGPAPRYIIASGRKVLLRAAASVALVRMPTLSLLWPAQWQTAWCGRHGSRHHAPFGPTKQWHMCHQLHDRQRSLAQCKCLQGHFVSAEVAPNTWGFGQKPQTWLLGRHFRACTLASGTGDATHQGWHLGYPILHGCANGGTHSWPPYRGAAVAGDVRLCTSGRLDERFPGSFSSVTEDNQLHCSNLCLYPCEQ